MVLQFVKVINIASAMHVHVRIYVCSYVYTKTCDKSFSRTEFIQGWCLLHIFSVATFRRQQLGINDVVY